MGTATVTEWDMASNTSANGVALTVDFDPQSLELSYTMTGAPAVQETNASPTAGSWNKSPSQQTGQSSTLSMTLLFDNSTTGDSVQTKTDQLVALTTPSDATSNPPTRRVAQFSWGSFTFYGSVQSLSQTIDYFSEDGVPLRATVRLGLAYVGPPDPSADSGGSGSSGLGASASFGANAGIGASASFGASASIGASASVGASASIGISAGVGTTPLTLSQDGDTLQAIAARAGGGVSWKAVAAANDIDNPRLLAAGTILDPSASLSASASASAGGSAQASASASATAG